MSTKLCRYDLTNNISETIESCKWFSSSKLEVVLEEICEILSLQDLNLLNERLSERLLEE